MLSVSTGEIDLLFVPVSGTTTRADRADAVGLGRSESVRASRSRCR